MANTNTQSLVFGVAQGEGNAPFSPGSLVPFNMSNTGQLRVTTAEASIPVISAPAANTTATVTVPNPYLPNQIVAYVTQVIFNLSASNTAGTSAPIEMGLYYTYGGNNYIYKLSAAVPASGTYTFIDNAPKIIPSVFGSIVAYVNNGGVGIYSRVSLSYYLVNPYV